MSIEGELYQAARDHLASGPEQAGFFLAAYVVETRTFVLRDWRAIPASGFEIRNDYHLTLRDEVGGEAIKWAWDAGACLVEAHSHGPAGAAGFSPSDVWGLDQWVPQVRWRLRRRPYAALVTAGGSFDALAWIDESETPEQITHLAVDGQVYLPTRRTLPAWPDLREHPGGE
jgi:hypothetical protein